MRVCAAWKRGTSRTGVVDWTRRGSSWWDGAYRKEDASEHGTHLLAHGVEREGLLLRVVAIDQRLELEPVLVYIYIHIYKGAEGEERQ